MLSSNFGVIVIIISLIGTIVCLCIAFIYGEISGGKEERWKLHKRITHLEKEFKHVHRKKAQR